MDAKQKLDEATERYRAAIRHGDSLGMNAALDVLEQAHKRYVASVRESLLHNAIRTYSEAR